MASDRGGDRRAGGAAPQPAHAVPPQPGAAEVTLAAPRRPAPAIPGRAADRSPDEPAADDEVAMLRLMLEALGTGVIATDEHGTVALFNPAAERLFGYSEAEIAGRGVGMLLAGADRREAESRAGFPAGIAEDAAAGRGSRRVTARRRDDSTFPAELSVGEIRWGSRRCFVGTVIDLSEWHTIEERLRITEAAIQDAFDSLDGGIALWTGDGRLVLASQTYRDLHPLIADDLRPGARLADLTRLHVERGALAADRMALTAEQWVAARLRAWRSGGLPHDEHRSDGRVIRIEDCPTRSGNIVSTCRDVTGVHGTERRLPGPAADGPWPWARSTRFIFAIAALLWAVLAALLLLVT